MKKKLSGNPAFKGIFFTLTVFGVIASMMGVVPGFSGIEVGGSYGRAVGEENESGSGRVALYRVLDVGAELVHYVDIGTGKVVMGSIESFERVKGEMTEREIDRGLFREQAKDLVLRRLYVDGVEMPELYETYAE